jgi:hypothetical protein
MTTAENKKFVEGIFDEMSKGNTRALTDAMADEFRWVFPGNWSWSGTWGPKSVVVKELLRPLMAQFEGGGYRSEPEFLIAEDDHVVVQTSGHATTKDGDRYDQTYCFIFRIADGLLVEVIEHCDTALVERVLKPITPAK